MSVRWLPISDCLRYVPHLFLDPARDDEIVAAKRVHVICEFSNAAGPASRSTLRAREWLRREGRRLWTWIRPIICGRGELEPTCSSILLYSQLISEN